MVPSDSSLSSLPKNWQQLAVDNLYIYAVFAIGLDKTILSWNPGVKEVLGYDAADFVGRSADIIFAEEDRAAGVADREMRLATEQGNANDVRWHCRADGRRFWATGALTALRNDAGELTGFAKVVRDSSRDKELEASLEQLNSSLEDKVRQRTADIRGLVQELTLTEQRERRRLAQTLHDSVQQELYAVQFKLAELKKELEGRQAADTLQSANELLRKTIQLTREVATNLRPAVLDETDLLSSLRWLADTMDEKHGLSVSVLGSGACPVENDATRTFLFNLTRELLFNVVKHAGVDEASVAVDCCGEMLELRVEDRGRGFATDPEAQGSATGLGLSGAHRRLALFGGTLRVASEPGHGTRVSVELPVAFLATSA